MKAHRSLRARKAHGATGQWFLLAHGIPAKGGDEGAKGPCVDLSVKSTSSGNEDWKRPPSCSLFDAQWSLGYI